MTDMTLAEALALADQDSPLPHLAGQALKVLRAAVTAADDSVTLTALIAELRAREALGRRKYGTDVDRTDLTGSQWRQHLREELMDALLYSLAEQRTQAAKDCWCEACRPSNVLADMRMVLCPTCGNKRCPHANDHRNTCTGSNAVGQPGSSWEHVKPITPKDC